MPLADSAYILLRNMIISGELAPDSAITENSIVERLAIGKTPVREAMRRLVLEGLLNVTPRLGYVVGRRGSFDGRTARAGRSDTPRPGGARTRR